MPLGLKLTTQLVKCGTCGKSYSNPLAHVCKLRLDQPRKRRRSLLAPKVTASARCGKCGKSYANPLTHTCTLKTDFTKRLAASKKPARKPSHSPSGCRDDDCQRQGCEGYRLGYSEGYAAGTADAGGDSR